MGRALAEYVVDWHRSQGYRSIQFNAVVETNTAPSTSGRRSASGSIGTVPEAFAHPGTGSSACT